MIVLMTNSIAEVVLNLPENCGNLVEQGASVLSLTELNSYSISEF